VRHAACVHITAEIRNTDRAPYKDILLLYTEVKTILNLMRDVDICIKIIND